MLVGYARLATDVQSLDHQLAVLEGAGCEKIFSDRGSQQAGQWRGLDDALQFLASGDTLVISDLSRMSRNYEHAREIVASLQKRKIGLRVIKGLLSDDSDLGMMMLVLQQFADSQEAFHPEDQGQ